MTAEMKYLMHLYGCGALGVSPKPPVEQLDWHRLLSLASEQSITYTVYSAINSSDIGFPEAMAASLRSNLLGVSLKSKLSVQQTISLLDRMEKSGIPVTVLKGIDAARYYKHPECRLSADTDLLISLEDEEKALDFFEKEGALITRRNSEMHHSGCIHPTLGMFELHISLWEEMLDNVLFGGIGIEEATKGSRARVETPDGAFFALGSDDALLFLTLHLLKHFLICGMSLRMIMDTTLYYKYNLSTINKERYWGVLRRLGFEKTVCTVFAAAFTYLGFSPEELPCPLTAEPYFIDMIIDDLEKGGWQGANDSEARRDGWYYFRRRRQLSEMGKIRYKLYIWHEILADKLFAAFPSAEHLFSDYPKLKDHRWLYFFCCLHRFFSKGIAAIGKGKGKSRKDISDATKLSSEGRERLEMFKNLGITE